MINYFVCDIQLQILSDIQNVEITKEMTLLLIIILCHYGSKIVRSIVLE